MKYYASLVLILSRDDGLLGEVIIADHVIAEYFGPTGIKGVRKK